MARFRTLDPAMRESPQLDGLSLLALLLLDRLIQEADDEGRQYGDTRSVWRAAFPRDNAPSGVTKAKLTSALDELAAHQLIVKYESAGQVYLAWPGWKDGVSWQYQNVSRAKPSRFPAPPAGSCPVRERGMGNVPPERAASGHGPAVTTHGDVSADVDVDRTGRGREADADADRTVKRAATARAPAEAGAAAARTPETSPARESDPRSDLVARLKAEYGVHAATSEHGRAICEAIGRLKAGDADAVRDGHGVLVRAQSSRIGSSATHAAGGAP